MINRSTIAAILVLLFAGCSESNDGSRAEPPPATPGLQAQAPENNRQAPVPPILETFEDAPQLSLFARAGDYRPEDQNDSKFPYWATYINHLQRISGVVSLEDGNRVFSFRSIKGIESVGFFSPVAVNPVTAYRVSFRIKTDLPEGAKAGIGAIEYDQFLWLGQQYPRSLDERHRTGIVPGLQITDKNDWTKKSFSFTTSPATRMVHLVLFLEGKTSRKPVLIDDISLIEE